MTGAFLAGAAAGYAIAIPVGAIAVLILYTGIRRGVRIGGAAATGAASADGIYALVAMLFGTALAGFIEPVSRPLRLVSAVVLVVIAARGLRSLRPGVVGSRTRQVPPTAWRTYLQLLALTLLNPATVIYFSALILGLPDVGGGLPERLAFVAGAFLSSLSWQWLLAIVGSAGHRRLSPRLQVATSVLGNLVILGFAALIGYGLLTGR